MGPSGGSPYCFLPAELVPCSCGAAAKIGPQPFCVYGHRGLADLKCVVWGGGRVGEREITSQSGVRIIGLSPLILHSLFSTTALPPLPRSPQKKTVPPTCRPSLEKLRCICKQKLLSEMTILFLGVKLSIANYTIWEVL